ncbi:MAG TPA: peptide chain release factor 1 [Dehalococcoidia bacterium]|nr:peptide chain release factor 1 [Dehalococcoidia bacterium]
MWDRLADIERRYEELTREMGDPEIAGDYERLRERIREREGIEEVVSAYRAYREADQQLVDARQLVEESTDPELLSLARAEVETLSEHREGLSERLKILLLPRDPNDAKNVIVEIRAAAGGDEAALFAADLYRMYTRYADRKGWSYDVLSANETGIQGFKEVVFEVAGEGAYSRLKHESGVHRVQRVPETEAQGRIHTSTASVAVLPEVDEVEIEIDRNDVREDVYHSGGAGGQNVNKVATAIRLTHLPTGIVVTCQDERSQLKNRTKAYAILRARLYDLEQEKQLSGVSESRRAQVGRADRSEKIRTYNFPQDRLTDHRIGLTVHNLPGIMDGELDAIIDAVATNQQAKLLQEQIA